MKETKKIGFIEELKRRNVFKVAIAFLVIAWLLAQVSATLESALNLPVWFDTLVVSLLIIAFPITLFFAWVFELTPEGLKLEKDIDRNDSITSSTGKKLNYLTIIASTIVLTMFLWQQFNSSNFDSKPEDIDNNVLNNHKPVENPVETFQESPLITPKQSTSEQQLNIQNNNNSIAVLPFTNMANNSENEPFTLGIHDDLLTHVSKISSIKVISRTSVMAYKNTTKNMKQIAKELNVAHILEGGVQRSGNQIRLNVQLIDANTDEHLWAEKYDRKLTTENIFDIQTEISEKIASALKTKLTAQEQTSIARHNTNNLEAYDSYLAGRQLLINRNTDELKQAVTLFEKATQLDPDYAMAYISQADALFLLAAYSDLDKHEMLSMVEPLINNALSINPLLAEAHTTKAWFLSENKRYDLAEESFKYSLLLNPNYATTYHWYGLILRRYLNRGDEALVLHRKAVELDPLSPVLQDSVGDTLLSLGLQKQALEQYKFLHRLSPDYHGASRSISDLYDSEGQFAKSIHWMKKAILLDDKNINLYSLLIVRYLNINDIDASKVVLKKMESLFPGNLKTTQSQWFIYMAEGKINEWSRSSQTAFENDPSNFDIYINFAYNNFINGNYKKALSLFDKLINIDNEPTLHVNFDNVDYIVPKASLLKQLGYIEKSSQLATKIQKYLENLKDQNISWTHIDMNAIQGSHKTAANNFGQLINDGKYEYWWANLKLPHFNQAKKDPEFIAAFDKLMDIIELQKQELAQLEAIDSKN